MSYETVAMAMVCLVRRTRDGSTAGASGDAPTLRVSSVGGAFLEGGSAVAEMRTLHTTLPTSLDVVGLHIPAAAKLEQIKEEADDAT